ITFGVTNARFCLFHGLSVAPVPLSTTPFHFPKPRARHEQHSFNAIAGARASVCRSRRAFRSDSISLGACLRLPLHVSRAPTADRSRCSTTTLGRISRNFKLNTLIADGCWKPSCAASHHRIRQLSKHPQFSCTPVLGSSDESNIRFGQ